MSPVERRLLLAFMRSVPYAVQASVAEDGTPQAAVVGIVVSDDFEVFFDTLESSRKIANLRRQPRVAFTFGSTAAGTVRTLQFEGIADEPAGSDLGPWLERYFASFPDGRSRREWPGITYVRVRPVWIRYSDYSVEPPAILELDERALAALQTEP